MPHSAIHAYAFDTDLIQIIAKNIAEKYRPQFPFLQNVIVLLPNYHRAADLQKQILIEFKETSANAMAGPQIYAFRDYIDKTTTLDKQSIPKNARELILIDALQQHKDLFGKHNILTTAYALLELFDELTRKQITLPTNLDDFTAQLQLAYQCHDEQHGALSKEAKIIHTLWVAWHEQLKELNSLDKESQYQLKLAKNLKSDAQHYYVGGFFDFLPAELQWIKQRIKQKSLELYFHSDPTNHINADHIQNLLTNLEEPANHYDSKSNNNSFFKSVFDNQNSHFQDRAEHARKNLKPINDTIKTFQAKSFEEEAQAITLQIRLWLKQEKNNLALILEDRRLARRVRALLQRSGIGMRDTAGWTISTTTAASVIESWMQCIEENFHYASLLDILKSPFAFEQSDQHTQLVFRFEQDLVFRENIARDLSRYQQSWISRQKRLGNGNNETSTSLLNLFKHLSESANPIQAIYTKSQAFLSEYLSALKTSLSALNAYQLLKLDDAGKTILELLKNLENSASHTDIKIDWVTFRHWLSLKLEENNFSPSNPFKHSIELLHLSQTSMGKYDGLIIGSMTKDQFPGAVKQTPFFNQNVRQELGLNDTEKQRHIKFYHFRSLLESSPSILLSYHSGPQESLPSPWLELLSRFHQLAFSKELEDNLLHEILQQHNSRRKSLSDVKFTNPFPQVNAELLPDSLSASAHQTLIQCPYAFFAGQILKLRATDEISEKLAKSDYGERIHLCLQAFHAGGVKNIPGPFEQKISENNKTTAISVLRKISEQIFAYDLEDNFQHRGWLKRWTKLIPAYINWQISHEQSWLFKSGEIKTSTMLEDLNLHGRVDRIDQSSNNINILDYKTGSVPSVREVETGEAIQLAHYAMAHPDKVTRVEYLQFESGVKDVAEKCVTENDALDELTSQAKKRLSIMYKALKNGSKLPAWGDQSVCQHCQFDGLCRYKLS